MRLIRVLLVDDYEPVRNQIRLLLKARPDWRVVCEVSDGLEAVQQAENLKPDLVLLDIGLPSLNGIEVARRIRRLSPGSKIIFVTLDNSLDVVQVAMTTGAQGYVYKPRAQNDLLPAIDAVLRGELYVSFMLKGYKVAEVSAPKSPHRHEVIFYSDENVFLDSFSRFIAGALQSGDVAIVIATEVHRTNLAARLKAQGVDIDAATDQGTYISLDAAKALSAFMTSDTPDPDRFFEVMRDLIRAAAKAGKKVHPRVAVCGECGFLLWNADNADAAIRMEQLWEQLAPVCEVHALCGYALSSFGGGQDQLGFRGICAEHSAVFCQ